MARGSCKGRCTKPEYEYRKIVRNIKNTPYMKCSTCCICIKYDGIFCPCCSFRLSKRGKDNPKNKENKIAI